MIFAFVPTPQRYVVTMTAIASWAFHTLVQLESLMNGSSNKSNRDFRRVSLVISLGIIKLTWLGHDEALTSSLGGDTDTREIKFLDGNEKGIISDSSAIT